MVPRRDLAAAVEAEGGPERAWLAAWARQAGSATAWAAVAGGLGGLLRIGQAALLARFGEGVLLHGWSARRGLGILAGVLGLALAQAGFTWLRRHLGQRAASRVQGRLRADLIHALLRARAGETPPGSGPAPAKDGSTTDSRMRREAPPGSGAAPAKEGPTTDSRIRREAPPAQADTAAAQATAVVEQVGALRDYVAEYLPERFVTAVVVAVMLGVACSQAWAAGLLLGVSAPLVVLLGRLAGRGAARASQRQHRQLARLGGQFVDRLLGLETLQGLGQVEAQAARLGAVAEAYRRRTLRVFRLAFLSAAVLDLFAALGLGLLAVYLGLSLLGTLHGGTWGGPPGFGTGLFLLILAADLFVPLRRLGGLFHARAGALGAAASLRELVETPLATAAGREAQSGRGPQMRRAGVEPAPPRRTRRAGEGAPAAPDGEPDAPVLQLAGVTVQAPGGGPPLLRAVDLVVRPGERVAVLGPSGAGKTTLLRVLAGLIAPTAGQVRRRVSAGADLTVGWVEQRPRVFFGTLRDNIALAHPGAPGAAVERAARQAGVMAFAADLPRGLDTPVGELGVGLSGGEAQRVAVARALLASPSLLLLDEPFAHLDAETEAALLHVLLQPSPGRAVVLATHQLAVAARADRVVVLEQGRVKAQGPPARLAQDAGKWAERLSAARVAEARGVPGPVATGAELATGRERGPAERVESAAGRDGLPDDRGHLPEMGSGQGSARQDPASPEAVSGGGEVWDQAGLRGLGPERLLWRRMRGVRGAAALGMGVGLVTTLAVVGLMAVGGALLALTALWGLAAPGVWQPAASRLAAAIRFLALLRPVGRYGERLLVHDATLRVLARVRRWFFLALGRARGAGAAVIEQGRRAGEALEHLVADVDALAGLTIRWLSPGLGALGLAAALGVLFWALYPGLVWPGAVGLLALSAAAALGSARMTLGPLQARAAAASRFRARLLEAISGREVLEIYGARERVQDALLSEEACLRRMEGRLRQRVETLEALLAVASAGLLVWFMAVGADAVVAGALRPVHFIVGLLALMTALEMVTPLVTAGQARAEAGAASARLRAAVGPGTEAASRGWERSSEPAPEADAMERVATRAEAVRLHRVTLQRPARRRPALAEVSLVVSAGERIAVVGPSGAGKTTLLRLMLGQLVPQSGTVRVRGLDPAAASERELRGALAAAPQRPHVFAGTVAENLRLGDPASSEEALWEVLARVGLEAEVRRLPDGLETWLGDRDSGGVTLSGGQARRLAVARVLLARRPVSLLDEPTEDLDPAAAAAVQAAILGLPAGATLIVVTHDIALARRFPRVVVLSRGRMVADGAPEAVLPARV